MARRTDVQYIRFYTDGSAARKLEMPSFHKSVRKVQAKKKKQIILHIDPIAVLGLVVAAVMMVLMLTGVTQLKAAQQQAADMEEYVASLQTQNMELQSAYHSGYDIDEVERMALALGMVPKEQVQQIEIRVAQPQETEDPDVWTSIWTFLTGMFA